MKITANLQHGSIDAEFVAEDRKELEDDLLGFATFLADNSELFGQLDVSSNGDGADHSSNGESSAKGGGADTGDHPLSSLARKVGSSVSELDEIVYVDAEGEEDPQILVEKSLLGENQTARQRTGAYIILRVWKDCYGEDRMKTSKLKEILSMTDVSDQNIYTAWRGAGKGDFDPTGQGPSATVGLTGPGKREALKQIKRLAEKQAE